MCLLTVETSFKTGVSHHQKDNGNRGLNVQAIAGVLSTASNTTANTWAETAWNEKATEETATTLDNINTQTQTMNDVIVQKINQLNKPL